MLDKAKVVLRVDFDAFDDEILMLIEAGKLDLQEAGVNVDLNDELIQSAIMMYVKAHFGYDNKDSDKQVRAYTRMINKLKLASRWDNEK